MTDLRDLRLKNDNARGFCMICMLRLVRAVGISFEHMSIKECGSAETGQVKILKCLLLLREVACIYF